MAIEFVFLKAGQELAVHVSEKIDFMRVKRGRNYGYLAVLYRTGDSGEARFIPDFSKT
jgi:hypothetical protein